MAWYYFKKKSNILYFFLNFKKLIFKQIYTPVRYGTVRYGTVRYGTVSEMFKFF